MNASEKVRKVLGNKREKREALYGFPVSSSVHEAFFLYVDLLVGPLENIGAPFFFSTSIGFSELGEPNILT